jgi:DNA-binding SARP family transcriptional activator/Tfp pilus assembly protein PilF
VRFRILGPLEIWTGQAWSGIGAPKWRALLAALLLNPGQVVSTERLIAELWGHEPPDRAANLISVYVLRLRRLMGDPQGVMLATRAPGYQLRLEPGDLDAPSFESLASQGRRALVGGDAPQAAVLLTEALALWRGRALVDVPPSSLATAEADRLEESHLTALELRITADLRCGMPAELIPELRRLLSDHPLREGLWVLLMQALDLAGRRAEAVAVYGAARETISDELGVDPGPELRRLYEGLLAADTAATAPDAAAPAASAGPQAGTKVSARPPAAHPEAADRRGAAPETGSRAASGEAAGAGGTGSGAEPGTIPAAETVQPEPGPQAPAQLPADISDFTGRGSHLQQLRDLLAGVSHADNPVAVTVAVVAGTPGLGKTALAVHAAHALRRDFPDGQLYVTMLGASEQPAVPEEILARLLRDLGVNPVQIPAGQEERAALYRTRLADRRVLIVLDDARDAAQVRPLLPGSGSCAVIVTSRHRLSGLAGSRLIDLDVLDDDEARGLLTAIIGEERTAAEPGPVRDVLDACAGLPLAIRIAGARLTARRGWAVRTLARRLADQRRRVDELTAGDLGVRACFDVSFEALQHLATGTGLDPAHAFRLLGVWQGPGISLQAAAALLGEPEDAAAGALETLVDAHLLESPAPDWYRFHDLLRAYAAERAQAQETPSAVTDAVGRVLRWYLCSADTAASVVAPYRERIPDCPTDSALSFATADEALEWSVAERANLVAATRQAAANGLHDVAWKLPVAMMVCFDRNGYRAEWLATHHVALASARAAGDGHGEAWVLNNIGMVLSQQRADDAQDYLEQALALHRERGDRPGQAQATNNIAHDLQLRGLHERAIPALVDALELQREVGHRYGEGVALCNLAEAYLELGRDEEAISSAGDALLLARESGSPRLEAYVLHNLGRAHLNLGHVSQGADLLEQAAAIHGADGAKSAQALALQHLGEASIKAGQLARAQEAWQRAVGLLESLEEDKQAAKLRSKLVELGPPATDS